jgi:hypothetical protein
LWRCTLREPRLTEHRFDKNYRALDKWLNGRFVTGLPGTGADCYVRGDNFGDKTQQVIIIKPGVLRVDFLRYLQEFLRAGWRDWRIMIATDGNVQNCILIYPDVIRINPAAEQDLEHFCELMRPELTRDA